MKLANRLDDFEAYLGTAMNVILTRMKNEGKDVAIICVGRKGHDQLSREFGNLMMHTFRDVFGKAVRDIRIVPVQGNLDAVLTELVQAFRSRSIDSRHDRP